MKKTDVPWMYDVSKCAPQEALRDLDEAYGHFFRRVKKGKKPGFPRFKSKKRGVGGFRLTGSIKVFERCIQLPRLGHLRLKESGYIPFDNPKVRILSATIKERAGRWTVSIQVEETIKTLEPSAEVTGVDVGISALATLSDGTKFENPKVLISAERQLTHLQRAVARKKKGSKNRQKAVRKLARKHAHVAHIRENVLHGISSAIAKRYGTVGMEDLNVDGMGRNHHLAKALHDAGLAELRRQVEYKTEWRGGRVILAGRFYPSSKECSRCHVVKTELPLKERVFRCEACGFERDRDENAAINLRNVAASWTETKNACGDERLQTRKGQCSSRKQEPNAISGVS